MEQPESVAILRFSSLGDVVLTAPALEALKTAWPQTRVVFAVKERFSALVAHNPHVAEVLPLHEGEGPVSFARRLRELRTGAVLDLHDKVRSKLIRALLPGVPRAVWHPRDLTELVSVKLALKPYRAQMPLADRYHKAVEKLVGRELPRGKLRYFLGPDDRALADAALVAAGVDLSRPILGLSPGANWATKRWPAERFGELARRALALGTQVVVQGSPDEAALGQAVRAVAPGTIDLCGKLDLRGLGGFISRCAALATNDSGPMHMSRGLGVPTLAIFGSTDPGMFELGEHRAVSIPVPCAPCSYFGRARCPRGHFKCMLDLHPDAVWHELAPLLTAGPRQPVSA